MREPDHQERVCALTSTHSVPLVTEKKTLCVALRLRRLAQRLCSAEGPYRGRAGVPPAGGPENASMP